jgi:hypothetical protein
VMEWVEMVRGGAWLMSTSEIDIPSIEVRYFAAILKRVNSLSYRGGYCVPALSSLLSDRVCSTLSA